METKTTRWLLLVGVLVAILSTSGIAAAQENGRIVFRVSGTDVVDPTDDAIESDEPAIPVAPGQISSRDGGAGTHALKGHFPDFNAKHGNRWKANIDKKNGKVRILYGSRSNAYTGGAETVARGFLKDAHAVFGMKEDLADLKTMRVDKDQNRNHVKFQQTYDGVPVKGRFVLVHSNEAGQVTMVQNDYLEGLQVDNARVVNREDAEKTATEDLEVERGADTLVYAPQAQEMVAPYQGSYRYIWKITIPTENPYALWVYHIDAESLEILYKADEILSLRKGKGRVFKSNKMWLRNKVQSTSLPYMFTNAEGLAEGWLYGLRADIYDADNNDPFAPNYSFIYNPAIPEEKPWFDATNAYYTLNRLWGWWYSKVLRRYGPADPDYFYTLSVPAIVNVDVCNAFYLPEIAVVDGTSIPGFVFGNEGTCAEFSEDLVLDQGVVSHEYAHAMMDWCGFDVQFGGEVNGYGRAMGEGNSDWFAYQYTKSILSGEVAWAWSADGYLRTLNHAMIYPDDVDDPDLGAPEEHYTGQIWGGYLYDLSRTLKNKALNFVYQGNYYFTVDGGHRPADPDFLDAIAAQILAEQDLTGGSYKLAAKAWGSMSSRGINAAIRSPYAHSSDYFGTGASGADAASYIAWNFPQVRRIKTKGTIHKAIGTNEFPIIISEAGRTLQVMVKATSLTMTPSLELLTTAAAHVASGTSTAKKALLAVPDIPPGDYVIVLSANQGNYSIDIKVK